MTAAEIAAAQREADIDALLSFQTNGKMLSMPVLVRFLRSRPLVAQSAHGIVGEDGKLEPVGYRPDF